MPVAPRCPEQGGCGWPSYAARLQATRRGKCSVVRRSHSSLTRSLLSQHGPSRAVTRLTPRRLRNLETYTSPRARGRHSRRLGPLRSLTSLSIKVDSTQGHITSSHHATTGRDAPSSADQFMLPTSITLVGLSWWSLAAGILRSASCSWIDFRAGFRVGVPGSV